MPREKAKAKAREQKRGSSSSFVSQENHVLTLEEVANRTLDTLRNLGNQRFALSPFGEHLDRWLANLRDVISEFESSPSISVDDEFVKERSQILLNVELDLRKRQDKEASNGEAIKSLSENRILLERNEEDYATATKEIEARKDTEIKRLSGIVDDVTEELNHIARMKTGIFRAISKKAKAQKEAETKQRLNAAQSELSLAAQHFTAEQEKLLDEHEKRKKTVIEQIRNLEKENESLEIDDSLEARRAACEALINAVNSLVQRKELSHQ